MFLFIEKMKFGAVPDLPMFVPVYGWEQPGLRIEHPVIAQVPVDSDPSETLKMSVTSPTYARPVVPTLYAYGGGECPLAVLPNLQLPPDDRKVNETGVLHVAYANCLTVTTFVSLY